MIGRDTNVLLRLFVVDDANQARIAKAFIQEQCTVENPGFIDIVVLSEFAWALAQSYGYARDEIADAIDLILAYETLVVERRESAEKALLRFREGGPEFPDLLISEINRAHGCDTTATFDRKAAKLKGFTLIR
jgi:predicted nucleic-acid-binding protein